MERDRDLFREALRVFKDVRAGLPHDAHDRARERLDEAIELLERAVNERTTEVISKRNLLDVLSDILKTSGSIARLIETIIKVVSRS